MIWRPVDRNQFCLPPTGVRG